MFRVLLIGVIAFVSLPASAQDPPSYSATGITSRDPFRAGGDVTVLSPRDLARQRHDNPESLLLRAPGVYVRQEDGFGLRPNIGMRGSSPERSARVALMEDGILFAPAAYSAPAAYYFPLMARINSVDVYHGPATVPFGPHTIGGAIDFRTAPIPTTPMLHLDAMGGLYGTSRLHLRAGASDELFGGMLEIADLRSNGFKQLDGGGSTGFERTEMMARVAMTPHIGDGMRLTFEAQSMVSLESSNETYLGLADVDFRRTPYRRYAGSQLDHMSWWRVASRASMRLEWDEGYALTITAYRADLHRIWRKFNRFRGGPDIVDILASPEGGQRRIFADVLRGDADTSGSEDTLLIGTNNRRFVSQGVQANFTLRAQTGQFQHFANVGLRFHHDAIERLHTEDGFRMQSRVLVPDGTSTDVVLRNRGATHAFAAFASYALRWEGLTVTPGIRAEWIDMDFIDRQTQIPKHTTQAVVLPAIDASYEILPRLVVFGGVHRGFSPVSPGQTDGVQPEQATAYEVGARFAGERRRPFLEAVGFYTDYENLLAQCTASTGCAPESLDQQFNSGEVQIFGTQLTASHTIEATDAIEIPLRATYSYTYATFSTSFRSESPQLGNVRAGDPVPYVPEHQLSAEAGLDTSWLSTTLTASWTSGTPERAGANPPRTDDAFFLDALARVKIADAVWIYARGENLTWSTPIASRFPYGARPGRPFQIQAGLTIDL